MSFLLLEGVQKSFGSLVAAANVCLAAPEGSRTAIVGPSGSGKTTLLRLIAGFETPDAGSIRLGGTLLADGAREIPAHQRQIGYVPQDGALFPHLTVAGNIGFGLPGAAAGKQPRIAELMAMVDLDSRMLERWPHELSGGQQQRVALARALAQRPRLMLLDEPFSALDTGLRASMRKAVARLLSSAGITTILVTHDQAEALSFADQLVVMRQGQQVQAGSPTELYRRPCDEQTARFLGDAVVLTATLDNGWAQCALGLLRVADTTARGIARILLRPEQLKLSRQGEGCPAQVIDVDFAGSTCELGLRLGDQSELRVRCSGGDALSMGDSVLITVNEPAHVLKDPTTP